MIYKISIIVCILIVAIGFVLWDQYRTPSAVVHITAPIQDAQDKTIAPDVSFTDINGQNHRLHDFEGKTIILNFWASWCAPCVVEFPELLELADRNEDSVIFIALSVDEYPKNIEKFIQKLEPKAREQSKNSNVIIAHDIDKKISQDIFQTVVYPETFIIAPDLRIDKKIIGITPWLNKEMLDYMATLK